MLDQVSICASAAVAVVRDYAWSKM